MDALGTLYPFPRPCRVGTSFFYFSPVECVGERRAVIASPEIHDFIVRYLMTEELQTKETNFVIGLTLDLLDDRFFWDNGKTEILVISLLNLNKCP